MTTTLKQHIQELIDRSQDEQSLEITYEDNTVEIKIDNRDFARLFLDTHLITTFNEYGKATHKFVSFALTNNWYDNEIPDYDNETPFTEDHGNPDHLPPEQSGTIDWAEYDQKRCEVSHKLVTTITETFCGILDMFVNGYKAVLNLVKILVQAAIVVFDTGAVVVTGGAATPIAIPVALVAGAIVELAAWLSGGLAEWVAGSLKDKIRAAQPGLVCALYQNRAPSAIKSSWDAAVDSEIDGIQYWGVRAIYKHLLPNRHARLLAEGVGQREWGATCAGCGGITTEYYFTSAPYPGGTKRIYPSQHSPPFQEGSPNYMFLASGNETRYNIDTSAGAWVKFFWRASPGGEAQIILYSPGDMFPWYEFPSPMHEYAFYADSHNDHAFEVSIEREE
jgi:hypothetical protein